MHAAPTAVRPGPPVVAGRLPVARGPLTEALHRQLSRPAGSAVHLPEPAVTDPLADDDFQLALYCLYELHYRGFDGVDDRWEWDGGLLDWRRRLEEPFEAALRARTGDAAGPLRDGLIAVAAAPAPSLSRFLAERGELWQFREFVVHRSAYQLKEADPHTWAVPRLAGRPKAALVRIQMEEYGDGRPADVHAELFAGAMRALGLDDRYGAHLDLLPGATLCTTNVMSLFGLHRRLRGALVGHLTMLEMTSVGPMTRYGAALRRMGAPEEACRFYDVHVEADDVHEDVALDDMAGSLAVDEPELAPSVHFGAAAGALAEAQFAGAVLRCWEAGRSSLRPDPVG